MAPFPDSSLSKVFLSLYLMNLSHPFSPRWSQGQMEEREHTPLQRFISPLSLQFPSYLQHLGFHSKSCPTRKEIPTFWAPSQSAIVSLPICSYREPSPLPREWERDAFLQLFPPTSYGGKATPKAVPGFQSNPARRARRKMPKMENSICPRPGPAPLQPEECVSSQRPGSRTEAWEGCD